MEVEAIWKKKYRVEVKARQFQIRTDEAPEYSGDDTGMMPTELFLASLASCFCMALVFVARKKKIEVKDMHVAVEGEKDLKNFKFSKLVVKVRSSTPPRSLEEMITAAKEYCFVSNTITNSCPIRYKVM